MPMNNMGGGAPPPANGAMVALKGDDPQDNNDPQFNDGPQNGAFAAGPQRGRRNNEDVFDMFGDIVASFFRMAEGRFESRSNS